MTKEEVIIALGLDNSGVQSGLISTDALVTNSVGATLKGIKKLLKVNLVAFVTSELLPAWDSFTKKLAGLENEFQEGVGKVLEGVRKKWREILKEQREQDAAAQKANAEKTKDILGTIAIQEKANALAAENRRAEMDERDAVKDKLKFAESDLKMKQEAFKTLQQTLFANGNLKILEEDRRKLAELELEMQESLKERNELKRAGARLDREAQRAIEEQAKSYRNAVEAAQQLANKSAKKLQTAQTDRLSFNLYDLAASSDFRNTRWGRMAREAQQLEDWAKWNAMAGFSDKARNQLKLSDQIRDQIAKENPFLKDPMKDLKDQATRSANALDEIVRTGIAVKVPED